MKRCLVLVPLLYAAAAIQTSLGDLTRVGRAEPDLLALAAVAWLLAVGGPRAFLVAGAIGLLEDLLAPGRVGLGAACFLTVGYGLTRLRARLPLDHLALQVPVMLLSLTVLALAQTLGRWLAGETSADLGALAVRALGVGLYTSGVGLPLLMVTGWIHEARRKPKLAPSPSGRGLG
jgi:rod shape-determining protein MreD